MAAQSVVLRDADGPKMVVIYGDHERYFGKGEEMGAGNSEVIRPGEPIIFNSKMSFMVISDGTNIIFAHKEGRKISVHDISDPSQWDDRWTSMIATNLRTHGYNRVAADIDKDSFWNSCMNLVRSKLHEDLQLERLSRMEGSSVMHSVSRELSAK